MKFRALLLGAGAVIAIGTVALAQSISVPQVSIIGPTDLFQDVVGGQPTAGNQYASALTLAGYVGTLPARSNVLVGGDATTNLWQRATTGASVTTTVTYGGPDRWAYWSGTSTAMTVSRDSTAADLPASGYQYAFKMARTSGQTGVVQVCMAQEVESANSYQFAGAIAELDFHATAGANFSAASSNIQAYIVYGTGADEGMQKLAFGLNGGGGGSTGWTGQANAAAPLIPINAATGRYAAVGSIPTTATEIGVALCWTPVGTAGTNDYVALAGIQLVRNSSLASAASATVGYACSVGGGVQCTSFDRTRGIAQESQLQYRYFYKLTEGAATTVRASCSVTTANSHMQCPLPFPVTMRIAPSLTGDGGITAGFAGPTTTAQTALTNCSALALSTSITGYAASTQNVLLDCTLTSSTAAVGLNLFLYDNGGGGIVKASAEL